MKLNQLYKQKLDAVELFARKSQLPATPEVQDSFYERAQLRLHEATCIAHCIALFGDAEVDEMDLASLYEAAHTFEVPGFNPFLQGLDLAVAVSGTLR